MSGHTFSTTTERRNAYVITTRQTSSVLFLLYCLGATILSLSSKFCQAQEQPQSQQQTTIEQQQQPQQQPQQQQTLPFSSCIQDILQIYVAEIQYERSKINNNTGGGNSANIDFNNDLDIDLDHDSDIRTYILQFSDRPDTIQC